MKRMRSLRRRLAITSPPTGSQRPEATFSSARRASSGAARSRWATLLCASATPSSPPDQALFRRHPRPLGDRISDERDGLRSRRTPAPVACRGRRAAGLRARAGLLSSRIAGHHRPGRPDLLAQGGAGRRSDPVDAWRAMGRGAPQHQRRRRRTPRATKNRRSGQRRRAALRLVSIRSWSASAAPPMSRLGLESGRRSLRPAGGVEIDDLLRTTQSADLRRRRRLPQAPVRPHRRGLGAIAVLNALGSRRERLSALTIPWCTYTDPEIAHVGLYVREAWVCRSRSRPS